MNVINIIQHRRSKYAILAAGLTCFVHLAFAAEVEELKAAEPTSKGETVGDFKKLDANNDGKLAEKEVASDQLLATKFKFADTDGDGSINPSEYEKFKKLVYLK